MLIVLGGLPATGKTTVGRALARSTGAVHLRTGTVEQAIVRSGLAVHPVGPAGYAVGYALAEDHLRQGLSVVAESVNPLAVTRDAWRDAGRRAGAEVAEVEVVCSDRAEHRRRVASRSADVPGLPLPDWDAVCRRAYEPWHRDRIVLDTAGRGVSDCLAELMFALESQAKASGWSSR
ncbi:AAA family ATPase [Streptacidiphilus sp. ASG 303]|uniref:AAA family ATPase n=1 Tax=Streptacidiphilus sp. ASG 303 TaxID=2896847 RepID=UPI001E29DAC7|nr:AAA family ATPase [Streptacidiphilus sp. ASG 303]MCD0481668.1 AAA family ATPase [Streptacidiphilus sp. ASG 303]